MQTKLTLDMTFMKVLKKISKSSTSIDARIEHMLYKLDRHIHLPVQSNGIFYIFDFTQQKFSQISDSIQQLIGYEPEELLSGGIEKAISLIHKDDFKIFNEKIFPYNLRFLQNLTESECSNYIFSHNYRIKNKTGDWVHFYQRNYYTCNVTTGLPILSFGMVIDISDFKTDSKIIHRIDRVALDSSLPYKPIVFHCFYPDSKDCILSSQERKVLNFISEGLNSKEIAELLHLSENTIINHRRNMQTKTNTKNVAELIFYACKNGIL